MGTKSLGLPVVNLRMTYGPSSFQEVIQEFNQSKALVWLKNLSFPKEN